MGNCSSSCLGSGGKDVYDEDEESRLLFDEANGLQYGSFGEQTMTNPDDTVETQREAEALQRVVSKTSESMVDVFEIAPQGDGPRIAPTPFAYAGQEARIMRYQNLLSKLAANEDGMERVLVDWLAPHESDIIELQHAAPSAGTDTVSDTDADRPFVGTFADAAAAMG